MTTTSIKALWLEQNDIVYINDNTYEVLAVDGVDMVDIHLVDDEGYKRILTVPGDREIPVICDTDHE